MKPGARLKVAVIGTGISGLAAAWLLGRRHDVTVYEQADRLGGHTNTVLARLGDHDVPVDTGFIVFNRQTYPNFAALLQYLEVPTQTAPMSFGVSLDGGRLEYSGSGLPGLFAQTANLANPRFWAMLRDLVRFYRTAPRAAARIGDETMSLGDYLETGRYGREFRDHHILPMAGAIWSAPAKEMMAYPLAAFVRFYENHGLLKFHARPAWETVVGGSRSYVERLARYFAGEVRLETAVVGVQRTDGGPIVFDGRGRSEQYDHVVMAVHADQALALLSHPSALEHELLGAFRYSRNLAVLHRDARFMPRRRAAWSSWNYLGENGAEHGVCVTYWMNRLQNLAVDDDLFVTLNPPRPPRSGTILHTEIYHHPIFDAGAMAAQERLWLLQGRQRTWFCGAYFGAGFHEDGLQAGLAVAEELGGVRRPWSVPNESGRIVRTASTVVANQELPA
jgi:predicted NAD/FAD-binding protein